MDGAAGVGFDREDGFIRLHLHDGLALGYLGAILDQPIDQGDLLDRLAEFGDKKLFRH